MCAPSLSRFVIVSRFCRGLFQVIVKVRPSSVHAVTRCTLLASLLFFFLSSPVVVYSSCQVLNSSTVPYFTQFCTRVAVHNLLRQVSVSVYFAHPAPARFNRGPITLLWSVGSMVSRVPILQILQCCTTEAETGLVPTSAQNFRGRNFLDTDISVLYSFLHTKISCIKCVSFWSLVQTDASVNSP